MPGSRNVEMPGKGILAVLPFLEQDVPALRRIPDDPAVEGMVEIAFGMHLVPGRGTDFAIVFIIYIE
jgi:hypothetical protein